MSESRVSREAVDPRLESGIVVVWFALLLTGLVAITALCVDIGLWYVEARHVQKAADTAALAGAVHLPGDANAAQTVARENATQNGYTHGASSGSVTVAATQVAGKPTQLKVDITKTFPGVFGSVFGLGSLRITRSATAEYETPVDMGSPANIFGNESLAPNDPSTVWSNVSGFQPTMWGNLFGYSSQKRSGDAQHAALCQSGDDVCSGTTNLDYSSSGYFYKIAVNHAQRPSGARLAIQVFDPAAVDVGDHCDQNNIGDATVRAAANPWTTKNGTVTTDAATRYDWGDTSNRSGVSGAGKFCTGDQHDYAPNPPVTSYVVRANTTPNDPTSAPVISQGTCSGLQVPGFDESLSGGTLNQGGSGYDAQLASVWRQWVPVCIFNPSTAPNTSEYLLQIRTNIAMGSSATGAGTPENTGGSNRFAVRAAWVSSGFSNFTLGTYTSPPTFAARNGITISGLGRMGLFANAAAGTSAPNFYMARVLPGGGNQTLRVRLFDIGDCGGCTSPPTLTFKQPNGSSWSSCQVRIGDSTPTFTTYSPCNFPDAINGGWTTVDIQIPGTYSCTTSTATDCWTTMTYALSGAGALNDTTTWSAEVLGTPVRLVQ